MTPRDVNNRSLKCDSRSTRDAAVFRAVKPFTKLSLAVHTCNCQDAKVFQLMIKQKWEKCQNMPYFHRRAENFLLSSNSKLILHNYRQILISLFFFADSPYRSQTLHETYPYDVTVTRNESEGFGFVIISSVTRAGSTIGEYIGTLSAIGDVCTPFFLVVVVPSTNIHKALVPSLAT